MSGGSNLGGIFESLKRRLIFEIRFRFVQQVWICRITEIIYPLVDKNIIASGIIELLTKFLIIIKSNIKLKSIYFDYIYKTDTRKC